MDVPSADADDEFTVPDFVPDDLALSCSLCKVESGGTYDERSKEILCDSCIRQWPIFFPRKGRGRGNDPSKT